MTNEKIGEDPLITNYEELMAEKRRLLNNIKYQRADINNAFEDLKDELNPFKKINSAAKSVLTVSRKNPLVGYGIATAYDFILKRLILRKMGWLPNLLMPLVVKKFSDMIVTPKLNENLAGSMRTAADAIREADFREIIPEKKGLIPKKAIDLVSQTGEKIADKLHETAEIIRPDQRPQTLYSSSLLKKQGGLAKQLRKIAQNIRG